VAVPIYLYCLHQTISVPDRSWLYLAVLAAVASCFPIRLLSLADKFWLTLSDVFVFVALFQFGPEVAVVVASIEAIAFNLRKRTQPSYRWVFNLAQIILVAFLVGGFFRLLQAGIAQPNGLGPGTVVLLLIAPWICGFLYYALSSGLTGMVMALTSGQSFLRFWVGNLVWYQVSVIGAVCAALTYVLGNHFSSLF
jgi:riboflavin transporter FmnP